MKLHYLLLSLLLATNYSLLNAQSPPEFRWDVKSLSDDSGIDWLGALEKARTSKYTRPEYLLAGKAKFNDCSYSVPNSRREDESQVVKLKLKLLKVKKDEISGVYHLVLQSLNNKNNIFGGMIPAPDDQEFVEEDDYRFLFEDLRKKVTDLLGQKIGNEFQSFPANTMVTVYGIPFWDCKPATGAKGMALNGRSIYPVLDLKK
jgi:hypothetical protein